ncbi:MAG: GAF domain-containing protein [Candidatus Tectomicrobia bacterium]|uniref:histidine kinase n=1 Tax=Tectimicrobiota bacterium TaxID=2528274 RepID=A0A937W8C6_UNCTE|nr:GAF domain-containing protein [Candidatus Tectomicrobia bacterium]
MTILQDYPLLPLLLFLFVLDQKELLEDPEAAGALGLSVLIAVLGFALFQQTVQRISRLASEFTRLEQGEIDTLETQPNTQEFAEMARIAEAFNKILTELKANTSELENLVYKLSTLSEVTELVSRIPDIQEILQLVLHRAMAAVQSRIGSIMLLDAPTQMLRIAAAEGLEDTVVLGTTMRVGEGIAGRVAQTGEPVLIEDVAQDTRFGRMADPQSEASSLICMPLRAQDRIIGVLNLSKTSGQKAFGGLDMKFLSTLLGHIGFAVENARLLKEAKEAALRLRQVVHEKNSQLELAQHHLQQSSKLAAPHHLLARMSHELRTPLTTALGYAQLLVSKVEEKQLRQVAMRIFYETQRATDTVRNLLAFVEQQRPDKHPENLNNILKKALERKAYDIRSSNIEVQAALAPDLPTMQLDAAQIQQVFAHALNNACQAMAEYGTVRKLQLKTYQSGQHVRVEIADTGSGIAPEHVQHVFTPFFTTKSQGKGMGLGLSIARDIVRAHQGTISVKSQVGEGAILVMDFPLEAA